MADDTARNSLLLLSGTNVWDFPESLCSSVHVSDSYGWDWRNTGRGSKYDGRHIYTGAGTLSASDYLCAVPILWKASGGNMDHRKTCAMESWRLLSDVNSAICDFTEKKKNRFDKEYIWNYTRNRHFKLSGRSGLVCHIFKCGTG